MSGTPDPNHPGFYKNGEPIPPGQPGYVSRSSGGTGGKKPSRAPLGVSGPTATSPGFLAPSGYFSVPGHPEQLINTGQGFVTPQGEQLVNPTSSYAQGVPPRYFAGDEYAPYGQSPDVIASIQHQLVTAGFLHGKYQVGAFDNSTANAYKNALIAANKSGLRYTDVIALSSQGTGQVQGGSQPPLSAKLSNPDDLRAVIQATAQKFYGGYLPQNDVQNLIAGFQQKEAQDAQTDYNLTYGGGAGSTYNAAAPGTEAGQAEQVRQYIQTTHPADYAAAGVGENFNRWMGLLNQNLPGGESQAQR
jgi:hypothetical protein